MDCETVVKLIDNLIDVAENTDLSIQERYDTIFESNLIPILREAGYDLDWECANGTHEEDVWDYCNALHQLKRRLPKGKAETVRCTETVDLGAALRYNSDKPLVSYILHYKKTAEVLARIMELGEIKYERLNWKKGGNTNQSYLDSAIRHLLKFVNGEPFDEEYGTHHLGHAIWNLMTMFELNEHEIMDDVKFNKAKERLRHDYSER